MGIQIECSSEPLHDGHRAAPTIRQAAVTRAGAPGAEHC